MKNSNYIKQMVLQSIITIACFYPVKIYSQQAGTLDSSFGNNGVVYIDTNYQHGSFAMLDAQNRIVSVTNENDSTLALYRRFVDGSVDSSFGNNGQLLLDIDSAQIRLLRFQNDEKILLAGTTQHIPDTSNANLSDFFIVRFLPDGSLDSLFGNQGKVIIDLGQNEDVSDMAMQMDSLIVISGSSGFNVFGYGNTDIALLRLLPDGTLDSSFATYGVSITDLTPTGFDQDYSRSILLRPDGKIVLSADNGPGVNGPGFFALLRYNINGSLDSAFGNKGIAIDSSSFLNTSSMTFENDLSILVAGGEGYGFSGGYYLKLNKYTSDGLIDSSFAVNGSFETTISMNIKAFNSLVIQSDHKIVTTGFFNDSLVLMRFTPQGIPDATFASQGISLNQFNGWQTTANLVCLLPLDKITVIGQINNLAYDTIKTFIARYHNDIFNAIPNELAASNYVSFYPNPATDLLTISYPTLVGQEVTSTITDITGKVIYTATTSSTEKLEVNTSTFAEGVYLVRVQSKDFVETKKVIITK